MSPEVDELLKKAMALTREDRGALAASLLDSLDEGVEVVVEVEAAWQHEIARRMEEVRGQSEDHSLAGSSAEGRSGFAFQGTSSQ